MYRGGRKSQRRFRCHLRLREEKVLVNGQKIQTHEVEASNNSLDGAAERAEGTPEWDEAMELLPANSFSIPTSFKLLDLPSQS